jgi:hypothetical protein
MAWPGQHAPRVDLCMHHLPPDWMRALTRGDIDPKLGRQYGIPPPSGASPSSRSASPGWCAGTTRSARSGGAFRGTLPPRRRAWRRRRLRDPRLRRRDPRAARHPASRGAHRVPLPGVAPHIVASSDLALVVSERVIASYLAPLCLRTLILPVCLINYRLFQVLAQRSENDDGHRWLRNTLATLAHA